MRIVVSPFLGPREINKRPYVERKWTLKSRVNRMNKKWRKQYGTEIRDDILRTHDTLFMSKQSYEKLQLALEKERHNL